MDRDSERDGDKDTDRLNVKNDANLEYTVKWPNFDITIEENNFFLNILFR